MSRVRGSGCKNQLMGKERHILIVDDEAKLLRVLELELQEAGFTVTKAGTAEHGIDRLKTPPNGAGWALALTDMRLPGMDGLSFLRQARDLQPALPVIVMTAFGTIETAVEAMKAGAADYVLKPFSFDDLKITIDKVLELESLRTENRKLRQELDKRYGFEQIIGRGERMEDIFDAARRVAPTRATVLIGGESGTGKGMLARAIHQNSPRRDQAFVKINCSAIPENLMESELFGYEKGAFTGATASHPGKFEQADGGTVFLDEIGDVPLPIQVKLLRVLQEREFERLGSTKTIEVDLRIIAATNQDLRAALEQGTFREDLYYRLNVVPINLPPLRERKEDVPYLVDHFLAKDKAGTGGRVKSVTPDAMEKLLDYHWPGNVRELENIIERSMVLALGETLTPDDIHLDSRRMALPADGVPFVPEGMTLEQFEQHLIREALRRTNDNKSQAARLLGITRNALRYRLGQMGLEESA